MERANKEYSSWAAEILPEDLTEELESIKENRNEIYDRFCKDMSFGTSGLRGKMGVGSNRINSVVLKRATRGVADYLLAKHDRPVVVIGYDTRINSKEYAEIIAKVLAETGVDVKLFSQPTPVPVVSFAIRYLKTDGGIMITASHNPKEYNGYKVYDHMGNQIDDKKARMVEQYINNRKYFEKATAPEDPCGQGCVAFVDDSLKGAYLRALSAQRLFWTDEQSAKEALSALNVLYTPLNGTGAGYVPQVLADLGVDRLKLVDEQSKWDGSFPTCPSPNPEYEKTFSLALNFYSDDETDIIVATDPDSDRMGVMARDGSVLKKLTGNQVGELMLDYICHCHSICACGKTLDGDKVVFKSYVSSPFAEEIADSYGVKVINVPTGFKNIAAEMEKLKIAGREDDFLFGFEESLGYLYGNYTRDKDGILAVQMICLMAANLKSEGKTLFDKLHELYEKHGYAETKTHSIEFKSELDRKNINDMMAALFECRLGSLLGQALTPDLSYRDINMFKGTLPEGHQIIIRPSGTEMKVKIYAYAKGGSREEAVSNAERLIEEALIFAEKYR